MQRELATYHKEYFGKTLPVDLEKELDVAKSEVEQQKEIMDKHFMDDNLDIPNEGYITKKNDDGHLVSSTEPDNDLVPF